MDINDYENLNPKALLTPKQAAAYLGIEENTLAIWRCNKRYPLDYVKIGRLVRYRKYVLDAFIELRTVTLTAH